MAETFSYQEHEANYKRNPSAGLEMLRDLEDGKIQPKTEDDVIFLRALMGQAANEASESLLMEQS